MEVNMKLLPRVEEMILLSIWRLGKDAYGMAIREHLVQSTGEKWLLGAIYGPISRLIEKGYITGIKGKSTPERGGRAKVYYTITTEGKNVLAKIQKVNAFIWEGVPQFTEEK
jgi:DNA-binding PadR family transcriptional regulator